jgi:hypothetical protein
MKAPKVRFSMILLGLAALFLFTTIAAAGVPGLCNTGLSNGSGVCTGPLVTLGGTDANWQIAVPSPTSGSNYAPNPCSAANPPNWVTPTLNFVAASVDAPNPAWVQNSPKYTAYASEWINPQTGGEGYYIYAVSFPVPTGNSHVTIVGKVLSDNQVGAIYLSYGLPSNVPSSFTECIPFGGYPYNNVPMSGVYGFILPWTPFGIVKAPVPTDGSPATLYFVVWNDSDNVTGLRVQFNQTSSKFLP